MFGWKTTFYHLHLWIRCESGNDDGTSKVSRTLWDYPKPCSFFAVFSIKDNHLLDHLKQLLFRSWQRLQITVSEASFFLSQTGTTITTFSNITRYVSSPKSEDEYVCSDPRKNDEHYATQNLAAIHDAFVRTQCLMRNPTTLASKLANCEEDTYRCG